MPETGGTIKRRDFLLGCAAGLSLSCGSGGRNPDKVTGKPNIIFILADDLGYGDLGCYGQREILTPNLDRLAGEGVCFTEHYAGSTVCAPSRCCLMTGLHTGHSYIRGNREVRPMGQEPLPEGTLTVARLLKQAGYRTALIGKWGLGGPGSTGMPNSQGFEYFFGYLCQRHAHNYYPEFLFRNSARVALPGNVMPEPKNPDGSGVAAEKTTYSPDLLTAEALSFIERNSSRPFFLYLPFTIPHANDEAGDHGLEVPSDAPYSGKSWPQQEKNFAAMVTRLDRDIGRLLYRVKELGLDENTLVIFSSDNGPHREGGQDPEFFDSSGPLRGIKRDLYEGGIRVPLIARWPGRIEAGGESNHVSAFWDFLPTAAEIAGAEVPLEVDGISYLPALLGGIQREHEFLYWEFHEGGASGQAVRMGRWKAVRLLPSAPLKLYDLSSDLGERNDVAADNPEVVKKIGDYLAGARSESIIWPLKEGA